MFKFYPSVIIVLILALGAKILTHVRDFQTLILCILSRKKIIDVIFLAFHLGDGGDIVLLFSKFPEYKFTIYTLTNSMCIGCDMY